jgi:hypothetical protein
MMIPFGRRIRFLPSAGKLGRPSWRLRRNTRRTAMHVCEQLWSKRRRLCENQMIQEVAHMEAPNV